MKPSSRNLWLAVSLFVIVVVITLLLSLPDRAVDDAGERPPLPEELQPYAAQLDEIEQLGKSDPRLAEQKSRELLDQLPDGKFKRWYELAFHAGIEEIRFYGRVVDQNGNPLPGARVHYEAAGKFLGAGSGQGSVVSGADGSFLIEARGGSLTIHNIRHPEAMYVALPEGPAGASQMYGTGNTFWSYTRRVGGDNLVWSGASAENPILFDLWVVNREQAGVHEKAIQWGSEFIKIPPDGSVHTVVFGGGGKAFSVASGQNDTGDLLLSCRADTMSKIDDRGNWSVNLAAVGGGIQATEDRYLNQAPANGYQPSIEIGSLAVAEESVISAFGQRYYFTAQSGQQFGSLFVDVEPFNLPFNFNTREFGEQFCRIRIEYKVNTAGSPYLFKNRRLLPDSDG